MNPIVIVDDDTDFALLVRDSLSDLQIPVHAFFHPLPALAFLRRFEPALVLLDFDLPGSTGLDLLLRLRANLARRHVPALLFTGHHDPEVLYGGFEAGLDDFLYKPLDIRELQLRVKRLIGSRTTLVGYLQRADRWPTEPVPGWLILKIDTRAGSDLSGLLGPVVRRMGMLCSGMEAFWPDAEYLAFSVPEKPAVRTMRRVISAVRRFWSRSLPGGLFQRSSENFVEALVPELPRLLFVQGLERNPDQVMLAEFFAASPESFLCYG